MSSYDDIARGHLAVAIQQAEARGFRAGTQLAVDLINAAVNAHDSAGNRAISDALAAVSSDIFREGRGDAGRLLTQTEALPETLRPVVPVPGPAISRRDWFAGLAMAGLLASDGRWELPAARVASFAAESANALSAELDGLPPARPEVVEELLKALELIASAKQRDFGIDYAEGCARAAIATAKAKS